MVVSLITMGVGIGAYRLLLDRNCTTCCSCQEKELYSEAEKTRANLEIERAKFESTRLRSEREMIELT